VGGVLVVERLGVGCALRTRTGSVKGRSVVGAPAPWVCSNPPCRANTASTHRPARASGRWLRCRAAWSDCNPPLPVGQTYNPPPMKFATYSDGSRDGELLLVARDLQTAVYTAGIASRLQQVLDDWNFLAPQLQALYTLLNQGRASRAFAFEPARCMAPLPRVPDLAELVCEQGRWQARAVPGARLQGPHQPVWTGAPIPEASAPSTPRGRRKGAPEALSDSSSAPGLLQGHLGWAAVLGDVPRGATPEQCLESVRLLLAAQRWQLAGETSCLSLSCAPIALTPDEWGEDWHGGHFKARVLYSLEGKRLPSAKQAVVLEGPAGEEWALGLARACRLHSLGPGTLVWMGLQADVPELAQLDGHSALQWSYLNTQGQPGFGLCAAPVDPRPPAVRDVTHETAPSDVVPNDPEQDPDPQAQSSD